MPAVSMPPFHVEPELCVVARCNDSLGTRGRRIAFGLVAGASLALGLGFVVAGAWMVLPYSLIEITVLAAAFICLERRAREWERLIVQGERVIVERLRGGKVDRREWNRRWLQVQTTAGRDGEAARMVLVSEGQACEFGAALAQDRRGEVARQLRRLLVH
jgi:uncharacterized membrane protein